MGGFQLYEGMEQAKQAYGFKNIRTVVDCEGENSGETGREHRTG